ncbi:hypothetical protein [Nocardia sp. NPDC051570]|uniref:hypothetical protein n=1 Tax=Nocardia sp. NPDC051570 TaxID=3364324 RepID=UPI003792437D
MATDKSGNLSGNPESNEPASGPESTEHASPGISLPQSHAAETTPAVESSAPDGDETVRMPLAEPSPTTPLPETPDPLPDISSGPSDEPVDDEPTRRMRGSIARQEPGVTRPRPPTLAESRARDKARKRAEEAQRAAEEALEAKRKRRKKMLIGGAAIVGVAAVVGAGYLAYEAVTAPDEVTAYCTQVDSNVVVPDQDCEAAQAAYTSSPGYHSGALIPALFLLNGHQYRYYYGGNNTVGRPPSGGSTIAPSHATTSTKSGTVVRGGLGSKSGSSSGGGSKSGGS